MDRRPRAIGPIGPLHQAKQREPLDLKSTVEKDWAVRTAPNGTSILTAHREINGSCGLGRSDLTQCAVDPSRPFPIRQKLCNLGWRGGASVSEPRGWFPLGHVAGLAVGFPIIPLGFTLQQKNGINLWKIISFSYKFMFE